MRRLTLWIVSTIAGVVLLLSYRTSLGGTPPAAARTLTVNGTVEAQSGHIDAVSGATVTSGGYLESLQAALDAAHFG